MMKRVALLASLVVMSASVAVADVTWTTNVTTSLGSPLSAVQVGETITIDVTLRSDASLFGLGGAAFGYDTGIVSLNSGSLSAAVVVQVATGPGTGFGGITNQTLSLVQSNGPAPLLGEVQFMNGVDLAGTPATGAVDQGIITGVAGDPQFRLIMNAVATGTTTVTIGTSAEYGDAVVLAGGAFGASTDSPVVITVPEPAAIASSVAALASVFAVVGIRRRY